MMLTRQGNHVVGQSSSLRLEREAPLKVVFVNRRPSAGRYSIEGLFAAVRVALEDRVSACDLYAGYRSSILDTLRCIQRTKADVFHVTGDVNFITIFLDPKKTILTIPDIDHYRYTLKGLKRAVYGQAWLNLPLRWATLITTISHETKKALLESFSIDPEKVRVVHCCHSPDFQYAPKQFCQERPVILQVGTNDNKNIARLIEALKGIPCKLFIIGRLKEETIRKLKQLAIDYEQFENLSRAEVYRKYRQADLVTFVSTQEGFGLPIIEANAVGRPVVTSNLSAMPEVAGDAACLVNPLDVADIRRGILKVIDEDGYRATLVKNGLANIKRFSPETIASTYLALYREIAKFEA